MRHLNGSCSGSPEGRETSTAIAGASIPPAPNSAGLIPGDLRIVAIRSAGPVRPDRALTPPAEPEFGRRASGGMGLAPSSTPRAASRMTGRLPSCRSCLRLCRPPLRCGSRNARKQRTPSSIADHDVSRLECAVVQGMGCSTGQSFSVTWSPILRSVVSGKVRPSSKTLRPPHRRERSSPQRGGLLEAGVMLCRKPFLTKSRQEPFDHLGGHGRPHLP